MLPGQQALRETLTAIEAWLQEHAKPLLDLLNAPASPADIASFEADTGLVLPPEARCLYSIHDGETDDSDGIFGCLRWLPLRVVAEEVELIGSDGIVPLFRSGGGDLLYVKSYEPAAPDRH